jgi:hypothetical protein
VNYRFNWGIPRGGPNIMQELLKVTTLYAATK